MAEGQTLSQFTVAILIDLIITDGHSGIITQSFSDPNLQPLVLKNVNYFQHRAWLDHWPRVFREPSADRRERTMNVIVDLNFYNALADPNAEGPVVGPLGSHAFHDIAERWGNANFWLDSFPLHAILQSSNWPRVQGFWDTISIETERLGNVFHMNIRVPAELEHLAF